MIHELFEQLDAFDPQWQQHYDSLRHAALASGNLVEYYDYLLTDSGRAFIKNFQNIPDQLARNREEKAIRARMSRMPSRCNPRVQDELDYDHIGDE